MDFTPNPVAFSVFGLEIRWYAIIICAGTLLAAFIAMKRCERKGFTQDDLLDTLLWAIPLAIVGARAWYVFFNRAYYHSFAEVINIRAGGLAFHGGLIFALVTVYLVCRHKKLSVLKWMDLAAPLIALGQAFGRWGNFFNQEAYGSPTNLPWAITIDGVKVHPTFLYESLWCLMLFFLLSWLDRKDHFDGKIICLYGILYSFERFFVEELRTDSLLIGPDKLVTALQKAGYDPTAVDGVLHFGNFLIYPAKTAQVVCIITIIACAMGYIVLKDRKE